MSMKMTSIASLPPSAAVPSVGRARPTPDMRRTCVRLSLYRPIDVFIDVSIYVSIYLSIYLSRLYKTGVAAGTNVLLSPADMQESTFTKVHS